MGKKKEAKKAQLEIAKKILVKIDTLVDQNGPAEDIKNLAAAYSDIKHYF